MTMAPNGAMCYYTVINLQEKKMDYENDYDLLQDVHEQTMWEDSIESYMEDIDIMPDDPEFYED